MQNITEHLKGLIQDEKNIEILQESLETKDLISESIREYDGQKISDLDSYTRRKLAVEFIHNLYKKLGSGYDKARERCNVVNITGTPQYILQNTYKNNKKAVALMQPVINLLDGLESHNDALNKADNASFKSAGIKAKADVIGALDNEVLKDILKKEDASDFVVLSLMLYGDFVDAYIKNGGVVEKDFKGLNKLYKGFNVYVVGDTIVFDGEYKDYIKETQENLKKFIKIIKSEKVK